MRFLFISLLLLLIPEFVFAEQELKLLTMTQGADGSSSYSTSLQILIIMTLLSLVPAMLMTVTSFTRIIVVLAILRQAMGTMQTPSNQILIGLALFTSLFIMMPVFDEAYSAGVKPYMEASIEFEEAAEKGMLPFRSFMLNQTRETDLMMFASLAGTPAFNSREDIPLSILLPSFVTSELKTAFQIGFLIFIPFLVIDLVVASVLMSMGMMMLSPMLISLPFKIMLFVLVDGWSLVLGTIATSFYV
ncbi:MAG: flagellar type III secretion system pore protein FliP [Gammaproteobacteria bacterium]|mgnify:FL=1|jgi:flagellar biosynthesis protein FliP|nr:flagellar type III secretion system pore protein FliP [Gammaproteobacteria bacterium]MBT5202527.1 flagellar type III secretion system pore protein FliP [Gammaproteobacteria bacterium]MBT5601564.1 flagellar type III secretion system pore protein FliP [Gammaproteobacteria bacterium]MBT6247485.1 flagellar type III secretion system pore protein FliP [Gammaproteobacteria bacterium]